MIVYIWTSQYLERTGSEPAGHVSVEITRHDRQGTREDNTYISFWPKLELDSLRWPNDKAQPRFITDNDKWSLIEDYTGDRLLEKRKPEYVFCFYTLDTQNIIDTFRFFTNEPNKAWHWYGKYFPATCSDNVTHETIQNRTVQSCVSLACMVLDAGKINKLLTHTDIIDASAKQQYEVSQRTSEDMYHDLDIIQPSINESEMIARGLAAICGYVISPDVLVERLKKAKLKEWKSSTNVKKMERMIFATKISADGRTTSISYSFQDPNKKLPTKGRSPSRVSLQFKEPDANGNILDETTYEWLPTDEHFYFSNVMYISLFIISVCILLLCYLIKN